MTAYMISQHRNHPEYAAYKEAVIKLNEAYGARIVNDPTSTIVTEGDWPYDRIVIIEFKNRASAEAFYKSDEYKEVKGLRAGAPPMTVLLTDIVG